MDWYDQWSLPLILHKGPNTHINSSTGNMIRVPIQYGPLCDNILLDPENADVVSNLHTDLWVNSFKRAGSMKWKRGHNKGPTHLPSSCLCFFIFPIKLFWLNINRRQSGEVQWLHDLLKTSVGGWTEYVVSEMPLVHLSFLESFLTFAHCVWQ